MNEFWALVLGSALGVLGGIIGTTFTHYLQKKYDNRTSKKEAYIKLLEHCNSFLINNGIDKKFVLDKILGVYSLSLIYSSNEVKTLFSKIFDLAKKINNKPFTISDENTENLTFLINALAKQMQIELGLNKKQSRENKKIISEIINNKNL